MRFTICITVSILIHLVSAQQIASDPGVYGPALEIVHLYYDEFPTGIAVSSTGRKFSNYPPTLDSKNKNYTVAELTTLTTETPYPSLDFNSPPGGPINYTTSPPTGANYQNYLIGPQSVVIDAKDRLWILDTGRALTPTGANVLATYGGSKLIGIDLTTNAIFQTILFPLTVAYPDSNLNDVRFDLSPTLTPTGLGVAYITDSSTEGRNGLITVDLGTHSSWRHLDGHPSVRSEQQYLQFIWNDPVYSIAGPPTNRITTSTSGADGIALSSDGSTLYYSAVAARTLYSIPTALLRSNTDDPSSDLHAQAGVLSLGQKGVSDGLETDSNGLVYAGNFESNAIDIFDPKTGLVSVFVRDPRIGWTDSMAVARDGYLYFTENQLWRSAGHFPGTDRRVKPYVCFRVKVRGNGTKVMLL